MVGFVLSGITEQEIVAGVGKRFYSRVALQNAPKVADDWSVVAGQVKRAYNRFAETRPERVPHAEYVLWRDWRNEWHREAIARDDAIAATNP